MKTSMALLGLMLCLFAGGCAYITEQDLADLQTANVIVKKEAVQRISNRSGFSLRAIDGLFGRGNEKKAVAILAELLRGGKESKDMQLDILKALGWLGHRTEVPVEALIEKLQDKDRRIRLQAAVALGQTKNKAATTALVELVVEEADKYPIVWALGEIGASSAVPTLNGLLVSEDEYVRYNASKALAKIGTDKAEKGNSNTKVMLDFGKSVLRKYRKTMMVVFQKIAGLRA